MAYIQCASSFFSIRKDVFRELAIELFRARVRIGGLCQASGTKHTSQPFNLQAPICILPRHYQPTPPSTAKLPPVIPTLRKPVGLRREESLSSFVTLSAEDGAN